MSTGNDKVEDKLHVIAATALQRTRGGWMDWIPTDDEEAFLFAGSKTSLVVDRLAAERGHELRILNDRGSVIAALHTDWDYPKEEDPWGGSKAKPAVWNDTLAALYDAAQRKALDIDTMLDATLAELNEFPDF